jgi:hypothetical protein
MKVLFILGSARCGSTIVDNVLNEIDGFCSVGEVRFLWERILQNRLCACRQPIRRCEIWSAVLDDSRLSLARRDVEQVVRWQREALRLERTWGLVKAEKRLSPAASAYASVLAQLYRSTTKVTGSTIVVDSSKRASDGALLAHLPEISPYYVHLVRDPRAVAYSRRRRKTDQQGGHMRRSNLLQSAIHWSGMNLAAGAVRLYHSDRTAWIRYEDFASEPVSTIQAIVELLDVEAQSLPFVDATTVVLHGNHAVSGNPSRFATGRVEIRKDDEWVSRMPLGHQHLTATLTLPLLRRYGYPFLAKDRRVVRQAF